MSVANLLRDVDRGLAVLKNAEERFAEQLAPRFRIFDYLRNDELGLSRCIADLLDAEGTHGQGNVFLNEFIKIAELPSWVRIDDDYDIKLEHMTDDDRRIDILLQSKEGVIGIENKPRAGDEDKQLEDYADYLPTIARNGNWILLYFSNWDPSEKSLSSSRRSQLGDKFARIDFSTIQNWLHECAIRAKALTVRVFIEDLVKFVRSRINGELDMTVENEVRECIFSSSENVLAALTISSAWPSIRENLFSKLENEVRVKLSESPILAASKSKFDRNLHKGFAEYGFEIRFADNQLYRLRFEFDEANHNKFFWGIREEESTANAEQFRKELRRIMDSIYTKGQDSPPWPWWRYPGEEDEFGVGYKDWSDNATPWVAIENGAMAEKIITVANKVYVAFVNEMHLLRGS